MYIRLSKEDEETGFSKAESDSIVSQRMYISDFLKNHKTLANFNKIEYVDDGFSGMNADRPKLTRMLEEVRNGKIQVICVKDFSRFFRDYIEAGNYLECVFPFLGVRFISINDNYDSDDYKGTTGGLEMVMRNIIYSSYSKDLSVKTTTARELMMKQGKFVGSHAPYGYIMHPTERNKLAIDIESAPVVRFIFDSAIKGNNTSQIAKELNEKNTPTPAQYFKSKFPENKKFSFTSEKICWTAAMVYLILKNERYMGTLVSGRKKKVSPTVNKYIRKEPILVANTHEAIVTNKEFEKAQLVIKKAKDKGVRKAKEFPLKSLVRCKNCGRLMRRKELEKKKAYFVCAYSTNDGETACPKGHKFYEKDIEEVVLGNIIGYLKIIDKGLTKQEQSTIQQDPASKVQFIKTSIERNKRIKLSLYEKYANEEISKARYLEEKASIDTEVLELENQITELNNIDTSSTKKFDEVSSLYKNYANMTTLTNDMVKAFVKAIYLDSENYIEIEWKFKDIFA